jgi:hypothetical protein
MAHGDAREGKWRGNWRIEWVASTLHTTSEHGVSSITTADAHTSAASSRLNWRPCRFKWTRPFRRNTKSGFCACVITFQTHANSRTPKTAKRGMYLLFPIFRFDPDKGYHSVTYFSPSKQILWWYLQTGRCRFLQSFFQTTIKGMWCGANNRPELIKDQWIKRKVEWTCSYMPLLYQLHSPSERRIR